MPSNALYLKASQLYGLARVLLLVFVFEDVIPAVLVVAGISLQRILVVLIQRNDYIPFESRAITLDNKQIVLIDSGIHHGIAFGAENVEISLAKEKLKKTVHVISTDTLVESPVVAIWATESLKKMEQTAKKQGLPIVPHRLTPAITNTFWVNLIGRGYPYPRRDFRWCTDRMKIDTSNRFIKSILDAESEAIMVLGSRKAESAVRKAVLEGYEKKRYRAHLSPNGSFPNSYVFTPIENWLNDNVWQYLVQVPNPWGHSNKDLLAMYSGASADGECPLVIDSSTPSCGNSRFGCWVCTMVTEDKSMAAMIQNDEEKAWMLPMLEFRNEIAGYGDWQTDRNRRDFRKRDGRLQWHNNRLVHGPYTKETREYFLRRLLEVELLVHEIGPDEIKGVPLITMEELKFIRQLWLDEFHEFDDSLPRIYEEVTGKKYSDGTISKNKYFGATEAELLKEVCAELYPNEQLLAEMQRALLDTEAKAAAISNKRNVTRLLTRPSARRTSPSLSYLL